MVDLIVFDMLYLRMNFQRGIKLKQASEEESLDQFVCGDKFIFGEGHLLIMMM